MKAARISGFRARHFRQRGFPKLRDAPRPCIVELQGERFCIVLAIEGNEVRLFDPASSTLNVVPPADFITAWDGEFVLVVRDTIE